MADPDGLDVNNLRITARTQAPPGGGAPVRYNVVTYNVGQHGPFEHLFAPKDFTAANVKQAITAQTQAIREINQAVKIT